MGSRGCVTLAEDPFQSIGAVGLLQEMNAIDLRKTVPHVISAVTARKDHLEFRARVEDSLGQFKAGEPVRQDQVGKENLDAGFFFVPNPECFGTRTGFEHFVAEVFEKQARKLAECRFVFNQQHDGSPFRGNGDNFQGRRPGGLAQRRKVDAEGRAMGRLAVDFDPALVLLDDPEDG